MAFETSRRPSLKTRAFPSPTQGNVRFRTWAHQLPIFRSMGVKLLCLFALLATSAIAQQEFENQRITDIQFSPVKPLDPADLAKALPFRKGDPLHADDVATAIDRLFASGRFEDIVVEAEPSGGGVTLHFVTRLTSFFGGLKVTGYIPRPPNQTQISSATELTLGAPFRDEDLAKAQQTVEDLLRKNGMYQSTVTPTVTRDESAQQVFLTLKVAGKKRARYEMPVIQGTTVLPDHTIVKATGWRLPIVHWWRQTTALRTDMGVQGVLAALEKKDRLKADVELKSLDYDAATGRVRPTIEIDPGPRVKVTAIESSVPGRVLKRYVPVFEEHAVDDDLLAEGRRNLIDYFQEHGYYDVDVDYRVLSPANWRPCNTWFRAASGTKWRNLRLWAAITSPKTPFASVCICRPRHLPCAAAATARPFSAKTKRQSAACTVRTAFSTSW